MGRMEMSTLTLVWTIHAGDPEREEDRTIEVDYDYDPGRPAVMYLRNGDPGYPAEGAELTTHSVRDAVTGEDLADAVDVDALTDRIWEMVD
jgi:hypothetical protein